jgi:hypothetical protein
MVYLPYKVLKSKIYDDTDSKNRISKINKKNMVHEYPSDDKIFIEWVKILEWIPHNTKEMEDFKTTYPFHLRDYIQWRGIKTERKTVTRENRIYDQYTMFGFYGKR